nr:DUF2225 domain-containing protein [Lachnospiraceae bacterium]
SYEEALKRYELAFATAMAITAKTSEKAYLCLSMSWLVRGQRKLLDVNAPDYSEKYKEYMEAEKELQEKALEGFSYAIQTENYPMCGNMDQHTVDYITAALYYKTGNYDASLKLLSGIIVSNSASKRIKDNARDLKDRIAAAKKNPDQIVPVD